MSFKIKRYVKYEIQCDKCNKNDTVYEMETGITSANRAKKLFRKDGWSIGKSTLCPNCKKFNWKRFVEVAQELGLDPIEGVE